jgi:hypothetical protein
MLPLYKDDQPEPPRTHRRSPIPTIESHTRDDPSADISPPCSRQENLPHCRQRTSPPSAARLPGTPSQSLPSAPSSTRRCRCPLGLCRHAPRLSSSLQLSSLFPSYLGRSWAWPSSHIGDTLWVATCLVVRPTRLHAMFVRRHAP